MNILVVINNKSGKKNAQSIFNKFLKESFDKSKSNVQLRKFIINNNNIDISIFDKYLEAQDDFIKDVKLLIIMGGDGTVNTILSSLIHKQIVIPIAIVPVGSGNGLFKSITYETKKEYSVLESIKIIQQFLLNYTNDESKLIKNNLNANLMKVSIDNDENKKKQLNSFLSITWGFISDVDINTEFIRCFGSIRFDLGAFWYLLQKKLSTGTFQYYTDDDEIITVKGDFFHFWACNSSWASENTFSSPMSLLNDDYIYISYIKAPISRCKLFRILLKMNNGNYVYDKDVSYIKTKKFNLEIETGNIVIDGELQTGLQKIQCCIEKNKICYLY